MAKNITSFVCQECGYDSPQWLGKCPECGMWNSFKEFKIQSSKSKVDRSPGSFSAENLAKPEKLSNIVSQNKLRIQANFAELNTVLGGGIVLGSVLLLAGDPGIGKSTLLLQLCLSLAQAGKKVLYISGEESVDQIKMRAERIVQQAANSESRMRAQTMSFENLYLLSLTDPDLAVSHIEEMKPDLVIVDSIQTMQSENVAGLSGAVAQVRYGALTFVRSAKQNNIPTIIVGHVTKEGMVAGPMILSHMVDCVLFLEGEKFTQTRILRSLKNRFGPIDEVGIFQMEESGFVEVRHPEQMFVNKKDMQTPGSILVVTLEGSRAFLVELQALIVYSKLPMPRRVVSGVDQRRVELLLAVLQKHCRLPVETMDVFVNVAGGMKVADPAIDLGICLAIYSSLKNISLSQTVGIAEVGLLGELRRVSGLDKRVKEAEQLGFRKIITSKTHSRISDVLQIFKT